MSKKIYHMARKPTPLWKKLMWGILGAGLFLMFVVSLSVTIVR